MQYNKVEICGVNTSKLKVLKEAEKRELLEKIKNGTPKERAKAREEMISGNLRLVLSVIQRFTNRGENPDDLFQVGCIGLIKAIDNFDCTLKVRFSTYGVPMIIGEIRRYLRDNNSIRVSRSMRDTAYKAMQVKEQMTAQNNKEPTVEEIAKALDMPKENVVLALEAIVEPVSLYEPVFLTAATLFMSWTRSATKTTTTIGLMKLRSRKRLRRFPTGKNEYYPCAFSRAKRKWRSPRKLEFPRRRFRESKRARSSISKRIYK